MNALNPECAPETHLNFTVCTFSVAVKVKVWNSSITDLHYCCLYIYIKAFSSYYCSDCVLRSGSYYVACYKCPRWHHRSWQFAWDIVSHNAHIHALFFQGVICPITIMMMYRSGPQCWNKSLFNVSISILLSYLNYTIMVAIFISSSNGPELRDSSPLLHRSPQNKTKNPSCKSHQQKHWWVTLQNWKFLVGFSLFVIRLKLCSHRAELTPGESGKG